MNFLLMVISLAVTAILSISGGFLLIYGKSNIVKKVQKVGPLIAFLVLLYAVFGDIVPEILEEESLSNVTLIGLMILGFSIAALIGFIMGRYHHHNDIHHHDHRRREFENHGDKDLKSKTQAYTMLIVDSIHGVADGIVLGSSFLASPSTGISACLATVAHEIPQEVGDFSIMQRAKMKKEMIIKYQLLSSLIIIPAAVISFFIGNLLLDYLPNVLAVVAGFLLYVAFGELVCILESIKKYIPKQLK